jgi:NAD(P)-dependent dehydrogenase (short-subunit alcohol dehydrogenase family)
MEAIKNILVTGAAGNLGDAVVTTLVKSGYQVVAAVHNVQGKEMSGSSNPEFHAIEASDEGAVREFIDAVLSRHNTLHAVILLVGGFTPGTLEKTSMEDIRKMISLNFETAFHYVRPVMSRMKQQTSGGKIIMVGSRPGKNPAAAKTAVAYALSKSLLFRLAEIVNEEGKSKSISATVFVPGTLDTEANRKSMPDADFSKWNKPVDIVLRMEKVLSGEETAAVIEF